MISSKLNINDNTFSVKLDNCVEVSGTFKVIVIKSNSMCALNFEVECNKHEPPAHLPLEQSINFIAAQQEISKKLSDYAFDKMKIAFPNMEELSDDEQETKKNK